MISYNTLANKKVKIYSIEIMLLRREPDKKVDAFVKNARRPWLSQLTFNFILFITI